MHQKNISLNSITQKCLKAEVTQHLAAKQGVPLQLTGADISAAYLRATKANNVMNEKHGSRHTITINGLAFSALRKRGRFGETYSEVILRILELAENVQKEKQD